MLPIMIVGGVLGAVISAVQGGSWLSDHINSAQSSASVGGKGTTGTQVDAKASPFESVLAAQAAGQTLPASTDTPPAASLPTPAATLVQPTHGTDYTSLARLNAGITAYHHVGDHHGKHPAATSPISQV